MVSSSVRYDHRRTAHGAEGGCKKSDNIRPKPLDFRASNGKNIRARDFSPPERSSSRTLMDMMELSCESIDKRATIF